MAGTIEGEVRQMKKRIPIGLKSYDKLKKGNYYVVDKTMMICDFLERGNEVTLITRPRRFGKTIKGRGASERPSICR